MPAYIKTTGGTWSNAISAFYIKSTTWRTISAGYIKVAGAWVSFFNSILTPSIQFSVEISRNNATYPSTLTGTNYSWTNSTSRTYVFQKSSDNVNFTNIGSPASIANPSSGSSNTVTYALTGSDFPAFESYFRFVVTAVNSTYSTSASSQSSSVIVYYGTPTPDATFPSITGSTTVGNTAFGNIGTWSYSPTSYDYRWFFMSGATSYPLTFSQARSVSNKTLSGFLAVLTTSANHGYKASDIIAVTSMDSLFNKSNATITSVTSNTIIYTVDTPTAWANAGTAYSSGTFVSLSGNAYAAASTISSVSAYSSVFIYSTGAIVYSGNNRYQSNLNSNTNHPVTDFIWWNDLGSYAPGGAQWTLQSFSNTATSGTTTGPNYYEGTVSSSTSISLIVPTTDYRSGLNMISKALYFGVKAYNLATPSPTEYSDYKIIYGVPSISLGASTATSNSISIPFTSSNMTSYIINVSISGSSISGYPQVVSSPSSPILISSLSSNQSYLISVTPRNGENFQGTIANTSATTLIPVSISGISLSDTTIAPSSATSVSVGNSGTINVGSSTWANGANTTFANLYSVSGAGSGGANVDPTSLLTSGTFTIDSTGTANVIVRAINTTKRTSVSWTQSGAQSYLINTTMSGAGTPTFSGNSSISNPSILVLSDTSSRVVTVNSITVYSGLNQTGSSVTLSSSASLTSANATTNTSGSGSVTRTVSAPVWAGVAPVIAPTSGTAGSTTYSVTSVGSWTNSPTGYAYLWQSSDNPPTNSVFISAPGSNTSSSYTPPANFFTLGYSSPIRCRVIASNSGGNSGAAFSNQATVSAPVSPPAGGSVSLSGTGVADTNITASTSGWSGSPTSYNLRIYASTSNPPTTSDLLKASSSSSSVSYTVTTFDASPPAYYFKAFATATNSSGTSSEVGSNVILSSLGASIPATPTGVTNTYNGGTSYTFSWTASSGATSYLVNYGENTTAPSPNPPASIVGNVTTGTINVGNVTSYSYTSSSSSNYVGFRVAAVNSAGTSAYSSPTQYK